MKKCYSLLRWPCLLQDVLTQTFTVQNKPAAVAPKRNHITHHFFVSELGRRKSIRSQNLYGIENVVKTETQQTFVNGLLGFITSGYLYPLEACVLLITSCELPNAAPIRTAH